MLKSLRIFSLVFSFFVIYSCHKENDDLIYTDDVKQIEISSNIIVNNGVRIHDPNYNLIKYEDFLKYLSNSDRFLIVTQKEFPATTSTDKVILSIRYDVDDDINAAIKCAYRESKYNIKSTYYLLHTASYYGITKVNYFKRNENIFHYFKKIQNDFGHEIGWHNDLVTLQIVYNLDSKQFLHDELDWLRGNGINIFGTCAHGSGFCYDYHYVNSYFWNHTQGVNYGNFYNWEYVTKNGLNLKIAKDDLSSYDLHYDADMFKTDYFLTDSGRKWYMEKSNFDTIQPGKKVILLLHPQHWN